MRHPFLAFVLIAGLVALPTAAHPQCPNSSWSIGPVGGGSTDPVHDFGYGRWNFVTGIFEGASGPGGGELGLSLQMSLLDVYQIVGPVSATPIPVRIRVRAVGTAGSGQYFNPHLGTVCSGSRLNLTLSSDAVSDELVAQSPTPPCEGVEFNEIAEIELSKLPFEDFDVQTYMNFYSGTAASVNALAFLTFHDLPSGYSITSCKGYTGPVVPAARSSWGALKRTYR